MLIFICGCTAEKDFSDITETLPTGVYENEQIQTDDEFIGLWLPVYEIAPEKNSTGEEYKCRVSDMLEEISEFGFTDIFVQVRANCDSIYPSEYFSPCRQFTADRELMFDALRIFADEAHRQKLKIHAWLNPYRVSSAGECDRNNTVFGYISSEDVTDGEDWVYIKPSSASGRKLILDGVRELVTNYNLDGIHIDDYFYPTTDESFDRDDYESYTSEGGKLSLDEWRRENVNTLIASIYALIKNHKEELLFSISPCGDIDKNFNRLYADVETWCRCPGFADMVIPQIYYGFENSAQPFEKCLDGWMKIKTEAEIRLVIGLAAYKAGEEDEYAGNGRHEWEKNDDILKRQVELIRKKSLDGFALFSYNYIFGNSYFKNNEIIALKEVI